MDFEVGLFFVKTFNLIDNFGKFNNKTTRDLSHKQYMTAIKEEKSNHVLVCSKLPYLSHNTKY